MAQNKDDYCLECHWEAFRLDGKEPGDSTNTGPKEKGQSELVCPGEEHHTLSRCDADEACCEVDDCADNCSITCPSVCDGFVDCDASTACSVSHCDDNCESNEPVCFDDHCFTGAENNAGHGLESFLGLGPSLNLETNDLLSSTTFGHNQLEQSSKTTDHSASASIDSSSHHPTDPSSFLPSYSSNPALCHLHVPNHLANCHFHGQSVHPSYPVQNGVNPADVFHMLSMCPDLSSCPIPEEQHCQHNYHLNGDASAFFSCFHTDNQFNNTDHNNNANVNANNNTCHHHHHRPLKSPVNAGDHAPAKGPCRSHHRCRVHAHAHTHPYSPYSRQSRSSISSHLMSSPRETPPPLDGGASSVITSPEFSPADREMHVCKWTTNHHGVKTCCGATFADAGALQKHLVSSHMSTVDGAKGNGYYCCWEGCHRPHEPFSQKSKLQGHFLTHSNCSSPP